ncbi:MAG: beta-ketoacyl synthase chain length factor [Crocinitomicaceae bacterium]|nr:beta-ketoacyl synthase chain length factor [Crocinitomicaceae bacterium]
MKAKIQYITSIGHQQSFLEENCWKNLVPLTQDTELKSPDYKSYIPAASLRRFSPILRMALTVAQVCQEKNNHPFDAISVGTSLGCLRDTEKFLQTFITATGETLSPTAFIQSTHNTIAGAISMALNNHSYNMTHTQNSLSFETALIDGLLCITEGKKNVLVGAADEAIDFLDLLNPTIIQSGLPFTSGATFLALHPADSKTVGKTIVDCAVFFNDEIEKNIETFLATNHVDASLIELVLFSGEIPANIGQKRVHYEQYTGLYYSSSSFAMHLANDYKTEKTPYILIINHQTSGRLGLTLIKE